MTKTTHKTHPFPTHVRIPDTAALKDVLLDYGTEAPVDFFILLPGSILSHKQLRLLKNGKLSVFNEVDETRQTLTFQELYTRSNIGKAMDTGNFYAY